MSYQDRKDIDNLYDLIWDFDKNQTQFASREEFEEFKKYVKLNYSMSALTEAIASNMDENGLIIFENLQDGLDELETNLTGLENNLDDLTLQLNGDENNTGFIELLHQLQYNLYGEGETKPNGDPYTYEDPMSDSLKGLLDSFLVQLGDLSAGDTKLSATLSSLSSKLQRFQGSLSDFRNSIDPALLETLDPYMVELIYEIASSNEAIYQHQNKIKETGDLIGKKTDSASTQQSQDKPVTLYGRINDTTVVASQSNDSANGLLDLMYRGTGNDYDPNADPEHPADNTTLQWLGDTSKTANTVKNNVGDVSKFTEATISEALKNRADGQTAINNKIGNTIFTGTISGAIASLQTNIGTVNIGSLANTVNSLDGNVGDTDISELASTVGDSPFTGASLTGAIASMQTQIGTVNINAPVTNAIKSLQTNIGNVNILGGSSVSVALYDSILNIGDVSLFSGESLSLALGNAQGDIEDLQTDAERLVEENKNTQVIWVEGNNQSFSDLREIYGIELSNINYKYKNGNYYVRNKTVWTQIPETLIDKVEFVCGVTLNAYTEMPLDSGFISRFKDIYFYGKATQKHRGLKWLESATTSNKWFMQNTNGDDYIGVDLAYELYDPQDLSNIGSYGDPQNKINKNIDTAIGTLNILKQDSIPNFSLISNQTANGMTVKVYSDGLNVYVTYDANPVTGLNTSSTNSGVTDILTISNTDYAPKIQTQVPARGQADTHRIRITASGVVQFLNGSTSATSYTVSGAFYYPLKSRIP